jgi:TonB-dependent SusC/RagA subfamily outer membrane receptor
MSALAIYIIKVIVCSGILTGYYWLALRNKTFYQWNRFYLLVCIVLSLVAPLLTINIGSSHAPTSNKILWILNVATKEGAVEVKSNGSSGLLLTARQWACLVYLLISTLLLSIVAASGFRIYKIIRSYPKTRIDNICFLNTDAKGTPFSFFHYIVWNRAIDLTSENGQRIFRHELVHVQQRHTWDKIFLLLLLVPFWINPFFWLLRNELSALHEFSADKKALTSSNATALAQLILNTTFPKQHLLFTSHLFQSTIKRRIAMFTKLQNPKVSYGSRIIALPLLFTVIATFSMKAKTAVSHAPVALDKSIPEVIEAGHGAKSGASVGIKTVTDTVPRIGEVAKAAFLKNGKAIVLLKNGDLMVTNWDDAIQKNYISQAEADKQKEAIKSGTLPLYIMDGKEMPEVTPESLSVMYEMDKNNPEVISINVLKGDQAFTKYGSKGSNGVIEITTKNPQPSVNPVFTKAEVEPKFPETNGGWNAFLQKNLNATVPVTNGVKPGTYKVIVQFIVDENGKLSDIKPLTSLGYGMEEEVVRLMRLSPDWIPATQNGKKVSAYKKQTVTFVISES